MERPAGGEEARPGGGLTCVPAWPAWATAVPGRRRAPAAPDVRHLRRSACSSMPPRPQSPQTPKAAPQGLGTEGWQRWAAHSAQRTVTGLGRDRVLGGSGVQAQKCRLPPLLCQMGSPGPQPLPPQTRGPGPCLPPQTWVSGFLCSLGSQSVQLKAGLRSLLGLPKGASGAKHGMDFSIP